jgi:hypothetical protein
VVSGSCTATETTFVGRIALSSKFKNKHTVGKSNKPIL